MLPMRLISAAYAMQDMKKGIAESGTGFLYLLPEKTAEGVLTINA